MFKLVQEKSCQTCIFQVEVGGVCHMKLEHAFLEAN